MKPVPHELQALEAALQPLAQPAVERRFCQARGSRLFRCSPASTCRFRSSSARRRAVLRAASFQVAGCGHCEDGEDHETGRTEHEARGEFRVVGKHLVIGERETVHALKFLARVVSHVPNKGQVLQRYYGWYASRVRGMRRKASEAGHRWAELLRRIFEVDPLACPRCGDKMRIVAFVTEPRIIDRILDHLRSTAPTRPRPRTPPRRCRSPTTTTTA
jgi:hypothetical protein